MVANTMNNGLTIFPMIEQFQSTIAKNAYFLHTKELPSDCSSQEMNQMFLQSVSDFVWLRQTHLTPLWCSFLIRGNQKIPARVENNCGCKSCKVYSKQHNKELHCMKVKIHSVQLLVPYHQPLMFAKSSSLSPQILCVHKCFP